MENFTYTTDDYENTPPVGVGSYNVLRDTVAFATGERPEGLISYEDTVDEAWLKLAPEAQHQDYLLAQQAAKDGDVSMFETVTEAMRVRGEQAQARRSRDFEENFNKSRDVARAAIEVVAASQEYIVANNPPEKIAQLSDEMSEQVASLALLEKELEDAMRISGVDIATGLLHELTPVGPLQGWRIQSIITQDKEFGISDKDVNTFTTRGELINMLQLNLRNLPQEQRLPWLNRLAKAIQGSMFTNKLYTSYFISMVAGEDAADVLGFEDWADRVGVATLPLVGVVAFGRIGSRVSKATTLQKQARIVAEAGGKSAIEAADATALAKTLQTQARLEQAKAGLLAASEATGVQGVLDLAKLASVSASRVLPEAITSPATHLTTQIRGQVDGLVDNLKSILLPKSVSTVNVAQELENIQRVYSRANNPLISNAAFRVADDGLSITGTVTYKPKNATAFMSRADAELFNKTQLGGKGRVVEDTTNTGFLVSEDVVKGLELERTKLLAEIAEEQQIAATSRKKTKGKAKAEEPTIDSPAVEPAALKSAKPRYKTNELTFEDAVDKAAYQVGSKSKPSKSDAEIKEWLRAVTGWDDKQIAAHAAKVREQLGKLPEVDGMLRVRSVDKTFPKASGGTVKVDSHIADEVARSVFTDAGNFMITGNVVTSKKVPATYVTTFIQRLGKALGMANHRVAVVQLSDINFIPKYRGLVKLYQSAGAGTDALHVPTSYGSIIIMGRDLAYTRTGKSSNIAAYMDLFAHEYGHAFEYAFQTTHSGTLNKLYRDWLSSKNISFTLKGSTVHVSEALPIEAMLEYRSISFADKVLFEKGTQDFISKYFGGNVEAYKTSEKQLHEWLSSYSEFFAENFSKWALTSEVPTSVLGEAFAKLVEGIRTIATELIAFLRRMGADVPIGMVDGGVEKFLNNHIKLVKAQKVSPDKLESMALATSKSLTNTTKDKVARVAQIEEELEAIAAAKKGLSRGFLVESDVKKFLTFAEAGRYSDEDIGSAVRFAFGDFTLEASSEAVNKRLIGVHANSAYRRQLTEFIRKDVEKLNKSEMHDLNAALVKGDQEGRVFMENELAGMGLTPNARKAYFKVRALRDVMYQVKNDTVSKVLTRKGFFDLQLNPTKLPEGMEGKLFGKTVTLPENSLVYNLSEGKLTRVGEASNELVTYELAKPIQINGKYYTKVAVKPDDVTPSQITEAIPYRTGEYSRQYEDEYWVKINTSFDVDGELRAGQQVTHRTAATRADAETYIKAFNEMVALEKKGLLTAKTASKMAVFGWNPDEFIDAMRTGKFGTEPKAEVFYNRTDSDFITNDIGLGGVMGGSRGERIENVFGNANTLNPLDSIAAEISNTAYVATTLEWREAQVAKWWNTFYDDLPPHMQRMSPEDALLDIINNKSFYAGDNHNMAVAYNTAKYIESQLNVLNSEEQFYLGAARVMSEKLEGTKMPGMHHVGKFMRKSSNWPQFVRTIAFHSYMGAFNIKHLFMQSMNAFNAVAISPVYGAAASKVSTLYGMALMSDNPEIWKQVARVNKLTSLGLGMKEDEFVEAVRAIRRSGLIDGIQFNSMWGAEGGKFGIFNGFTRRLGKVSATPFNIGDGYSRLVSFDIARREWKAANPGKAWWADDALEAIIARQDDLTQNMTAANRANWQRGAASIPFQFTQYQIKIALNIMQSLKGNTRTFTRAEAIQLFVGHTAFLGLAGWGLLPDEWLDQLTDGLPESERLSIQQGIFSWGIYHLTGGEAKLAIGSTFGTFNYYKEILDGLLDPEKTLVEALSGAGGAAAFNWMGKAGNVIGILYDRDITIDSTKDMLAELGTGFSSINNAYKAYIAANSYNIVKSKSGRNQYHATDLELYALGVGVPPSKQFELDKLITDDVKRRKELKSVGQELSRQMMLAAVAQNNNDTKSFQYRMNVVKGILEAHRNNMDDYNYLLGEMYRSEYSTKLQELLIENMRKDLPPPSMMLEKPFRN